MRTRHWLGLLLLPGLMGPALASPLTEAQIPAPLKPWKDWVLQGHEDRLCPPGMEKEAPLCVWPSALRLDLNNAGGRFSLSARLYAPGWLMLPGDGPVWPQEVSANGKAAPVVQHENKPALWLAPGDYRIEGSLPWKQLPEALAIPEETGLINLTVNGEARPSPLRSDDSLSLGRSTATTTPQGDHIALKVFRRVDDGIPLLLTTHIELEVSGKTREDSLGPVLPSGFVPLSLAGNLPARLDPDGKLHVELRPGLWSLDVVARATAPITNLSSASLPEPWPAEEVWSFLAHPELRVVDVGGASTVDPRQTQMPDDWRNLPAYLLGSGKSLSLSEKQRGMATQEPDQLQLQRQLWLDSDGGGYTLQDHLSGVLKSHWRLDAELPVTLGQVQIANQPQLITRHGNTGGVEVRTAALSLSADSRINSDIRRLPVSGWNTDIQNVSLQLHLPPGWRLFAAPGTDNVPDSWLSRWTLLDLFVVLIASVASLRLFGPAVCALTLVTLALTWQEAGAPHWLWIQLIGVIALVRVIPKSFDGSGLRTWLGRYRWVAALMVVLVATPFAIDQVRVALYPQLEADLLHEEGAPHGFSLMAKKEEVAAAATEAPADAAPEPEMEAKAIAGKALAKAKEAQSDVFSSSLRRLDPSIVTQTGPGLPQWTGRTVGLQWNGSVSAGQTYRLWLQPPWLTRTLEVLSLLLMAALLAALLEIRPRGQGSLPWRGLGKSVASGLMLALLFTAAPPTAKAEAPMPDASTPSEPETSAPATSLLDQLRERLLAAPACAPDCADIPRLRVGVSGQRLDLRLTVDAQSTAALPLPVPPQAKQADGGEARVWQADTVQVDGQPAALRRDGGGLLWTSVGAGRHEVVISGSLAGFAQLQLPLPLKPHTVISDTGGWALGGVNEQGAPGDTLQLSPPADTRQEVAGASQQTTLNPLLHITRTVHLGLDWDVETTVERAGASQSAALLNIPLLSGEVVTGEDVRVINGQVQASFAPGQTQYHWTSRLPISAALMLSAPKNTDAYEIWQFRIEPLWHVDFSGLPAVHQEQDGFWTPSFQPWPGESLKLAISRPAGAEGRTLTLDHATLQWQPTTRATDAILTLQLRSSQGGQHRLKLPAGLSPVSLSIDGNSSAPRIENGNLILPLHPGAQTIELKLHGNEGLHALESLPRFDLGLPGVNASLNIVLPEDRWVLFTGGPQQGPAVLFWGVLVVLFLVAYGLGHVTLTPLRGRHWALLMIGLSQLPVIGAALVVLWLIALGARGRLPESANKHFNSIQVALVLLSLTAFALLFGAIARGLLGQPDMQVLGNNSTALNLLWFQDRFGPTLPGAWVLSVSIWIYRLMMLIWALWLANALLSWLRWGWAQFSAQGLWRKTTRVVKPAPVPATPPKNVEGQK